MGNKIFCRSKFLGFKFWTLDLDWVLGFGFWVLGFGFWAFGFWDLGFGLLGFGFEKWLRRFNGMIRNLDCRFKVGSMNEVGVMVWGGLWLG